MPTQPLTVAESLALFDQAAQLRLEETAPPRSPVELAEAFQQASAAQGLPVTAEFAAQVVARAQDAPAPPAIVPWERPATAHAWLTEVKALQHAQARHRRREDRVGRGMWWGNVGLGALVALCVGLHPDPVTPIWLLWMVGCLLGTLAGLISGVISLFVWVCIFVDDEGPAHRLHQLQEAQISEAQAQAYAEVPGLAAQLGAALQTSVPLLALDVEAANAALQAHQQQRQQAQAATEAERQHAEDRAAKAWLRAQHVPEG